MEEKNKINEVEAKVQGSAVVFTYLVTKDIVETLERKLGYSLDREIKEEVRDLENRFLYDFWQYIPENLDKVAVNANPVSAQLETMVRRNGFPVISLDRVYLTNADEYLEVTRITDPKTGEVKVSERPGNRPLDEQISSLRKYEKIVLADVGAFEGGTLLEISEMLENSGLDIEEIYLGFSSNKANRRINNNRKLTALNLFDFYEWIEMRDFFGIDGRNVGMDSDTRLYIPYWENLPKWASISKEKEREVAELCKDYNGILLGLLKQEEYDVRKIGRMIKYEGGK
ncbi:MAG: hypothetical protein QT08_C0009G0066 [archaeon GW2011_AR17]|nr:MAG: hypothetical protein QT08_C0009G0066 [archaeon GW2011_AR17]MBS3154142.1 hypothetical protein [Candidatus Woesearchaeota archaeon]HIH14819.1 hypothetical protein [Nanoarchaeota archaeon]HIH59028.1 hypothetical protein [Nanoarchaeota archaeon]HII14416.1 hypothetical protein [Nanoarchaeota archaeon]